jgi:hypothetical protein
LPQAKISGVSAFEIDVREGFSIVLEGASTNCRWFADEDQVLTIKRSDDTYSADITADAVGTSEIRVESKQGNLSIKITVRPLPAARLLITGGNVEEK